MAAHLSIFLKPVVFWEADCRKLGSDSLYYTVEFYESKALRVNLIVRLRGCRDIQRYSSFPSDSVLKRKRPITYNYYSPCSRLPEKEKKENRHRI